VPVRVLFVVYYAVLHDNSFERKLCSIGNRYFLVMTMNTECQKRCIYSTISHARNVQVVFQVLWVVPVELLHKQDTLMRLMIIIAEEVKVSISPRIPGAGRVVKEEHTGVVAPACLDFDEPYITPEEDRPDTSEGQMYAGESGATIHEHNHWVFFRMIVRLNEEVVQISCLADIVVP